MMIFYQFEYSQRKRKRKTCRMCGKIFLDIHPRQRYCLECRSIKRKTKPKEYKICKYCGFPFLSRTKNHIFCSSRCCHSFHYYLKKQSRFISKKCKECHHTFKTTNNQQIFCSKKCSRKYLTRKYHTIVKQKNRLKYKPVCKICGKSFDFLSTHKKYCSKECRNKAKTIQRNINTKSKGYRRCLTCNKKFLVDRDHFKFCSQKCRKNYANKKKIKCLNCNKYFIPESYKRRHTFCSVNCYKEYLKGKRICIRCGDSTYSLNPREKYCPICKELL